jgi:hypothetical protein
MEPINIPYLIILKIKYKLILPKFEELNNKDRLESKILN